MRQNNRSETTSAASDHETLFCSVVVDSMADTPVHGETFPVIAGIPRVVGVLPPLRIQAPQPSERSSHERSQECSQENVSDTGSVFSEKTPISPVSSFSEPDRLAENPPIIAILKASTPTDPEPEPSWTRSAAVPQVVYARRRGRTMTGVTVLVLTAVAVFYGIHQTIRPVMPTHRTTTQVAQNEPVTEPATLQTDPSNHFSSSNSSISPSFAPETVHRNQKPIGDLADPSLDETNTKTFASTEVPGLDSLPSDRFGGDFPKRSNETDAMVSLPAPQAVADASDVIVTDPLPSLPTLPGTPVLPEHEENNTATDGVFTLPSDGGYPDTGFATIRILPEGSAEPSQTECNELGAR